MPKRQSVRLMAPFAMHCLSCEQFIYRGTKFNARKSATDETYLGIRIWAFEFRCPRCGSEIVFKTDPKTESYAMCAGAERNLEPWRNKAAEQESDAQRLERIEQERKQAAGAANRDILADLAASTAQASEESRKDQELARIQQQMEHLESMRGITTPITRPSPEVSNTVSTKGRIEKQRPRAVLPQPKRRKNLTMHLKHERTT